MAGKLLKTPEMGDSTWLTGVRSKAAMLLGLAAVLACCPGCLTQNALENAKTVSHLECKPAALSSADILDVDSLAQKLLKLDDPVSDFVGRTMEPYYYAHLRAYQAGKEDTNQLRRELVTALNDSMGRLNMYDSNRFKNVPLRPTTRKILNEYKEPKDRGWVNRLLLEDAYPTELARLPEPTVVVDRKGKGYAVVPLAVMGDVILLPVYVIAAPVVLFAAIMLANNHGC